MKLGTVFVLLGWLLLFLSICLLLPLGISFYYQDGLWRTYLLSGAVGIVIGACLVAPFVTERDIGHKEGFAIVGLGWLSAAGLGALPYFLSGRIPNYIDAYFEAMSGFTTTGSTILTKVEALGPSLLFWRALTHWLGGMGIIVLTLAILPILGIGGMQLFQAEMPGPTKDRLAPRIQDTARILWSVYVLFTCLEIFLLMLGGMGLFDATCHAFATLATGGFSTKTASIAAYDSVYIETVITVFMILAGINFTLHHRFLRGNFIQALRSEELRFYLSVGAVATLLLTIMNFFSGTYSGPWENLRYASFQVWSILTTTGFGTADFDQWYPACKVILVALMFLGGMAGSTGGGIKHVRALLFWKFTRMQVTKLIHPRAVETVKLDGHRVPNDVLQAILGFLSLYVFVFIAGTIIVTGEGVDIVTGATAVIATLNNIGPGLAGVGAAQNFSTIPYLSKVVLIICMVAGRLELYTLAILLVPGYWKGAKSPRIRFISR